MAKYLGENSIKNLLTLINTNFVRKAFKTNNPEEYKVLSDNNLTDDMVSNLEFASEHSSSNHAPTNAERNTITSIQVNGVEVSPTADRMVSISVPEEINDISSNVNNTTDYVTAKAVVDYVRDFGGSGGGAGLTFKILVSGEYNENTGIPSIGGISSVIYLVPNGNAGSDIYNEYIYVNDNFECIGSTAVDLSGYIKKDDMKEMTALDISGYWSSVNQ